MTIDLTTTDLFQWEVCSKLPLHEVISYLNKYFIFILNSTKNVGIKIYNEQRKCIDILTVDYEHFRLMMANKKVGPS